MDRHFGPFRLVGRIALGDHAEVVAATTHVRASADRTNAGLLAVKRLTREMVYRPAVRALFAEECALATLLEHPHIARALEAGAVGDEPYLAMEYIPGVDVRDLVEKSARLPPGVIARIGLDMCAALAYLRAARDPEGRPLTVVHRDVAPGNIQCGRDGLVRLIDFSAAWSALSDPADGTVRGTFAYMSPEQVRGQRLDGRSDLFSLAVVLWELFAQRRLFHRQAQYLTLAAVVEQPVPALADVAGLNLGHATADIDQFFGRALAKDRDARFADADEMAGALTDLVDRFGWDARPDALAACVSAVWPARTPGPG